MKNVAQEAEIGTRENSTSSDSQLDAEHIHYLKLTGNSPVQVYVQPYTASDNKTKAQFASSSTGPYYHAIKWKSGTEYSLFVTFNFQANGTTTITSLDWEAPIPMPYTPVNSQSQSCAIPPVRGIYRFFVNFSTGEKHDPQIVVTPQ